MELENLQANLKNNIVSANGRQMLLRFDNGYGASIVRHEFSYGGEVGLFELAVIKWDGDNFVLVYNTP